MQDDKTSQDWVENARRQNKKVVGLGGKWKTTKIHKTESVSGKGRTTKSHTTGWKMKDDEESKDRMENDSYDKRLQDTMEDKYRTMNNIGVGGKCRPEAS